MDVGESYSVCCCRCQSLTYRRSFCSPSPFPLYLRDTALRHAIPTSNPLYVWHFRYLYTIRLARIPAIKRACCRYSSPVHVSSPYQSRSFWINTSLNSLILFRISPRYLEPFLPVAFLFNPLRSAPRVCYSCRGARHPYQDQHYFMQHKNSSPLSLTDRLKPLEGSTQSYIIYGVCPTKPVLGCVCDRGGAKVSAFSWILVQNPLSIWKVVLPRSLWASISIRMFVNCSPDRPSPSPSQMSEARNLITSNNLVVLNSFKIKKSLQEGGAIPYGQRFVNRKQGFLCPIFQNYITDPGWCTSVSFHSYRHLHTVQGLKNLSNFESTVSHLEYHPIAGE